MDDVLLAVTSTLLGVSLLGNGYLGLTRHRVESYWSARERQALDRANAAELRSAQQIDAMLERISTAPRLDLDTGRAVHPIDPSERKFFADDDDPLEDQAWNEYRGDPEEVE